MGIDEATHRQLARTVEPLVFSGGIPVFPARVDQLLTSFAGDVLGEDWTSNADVVARMKEAMDACLQDLVEPTPPAWSADKYMAATLALAPLHFYKTTRALLELLRSQPISRGTPIRILDAGCGTGLSSIACLYFLECLAHALDACDVMGDEGRVVAMVTPLDANLEALEMYKRLVWTYTPHFANFFFEVQPNIQHKIGEGDLSAAAGGQQFDIILASHLAGEMRDQGLDWRAQQLVELGKLLDPAGSLVMVETMSPGGAPAINQLKSRVVSKGLDMLGPCAHIGGKPAGPICFTCHMSRMDEPLPPSITRRFLGTIRGIGFRDLVARNIWTYAVFRPDGAVGHPAVDPQSARIGATARQAAAGAAGDLTRGDFVVQIAKAESAPFFHYKVCDQTAKTDDCLVWFSPEIAPLTFEIGDVLRLRNAKIDLTKPAGAEKLKNVFGLVVDGSTGVERIAPHAGRSGLILGP